MTVRLRNTAAGIQSGLGSVIVWKRVVLAVIFVARGIRVGEPDIAGRNAKRPALLFVLGQFVRVERRDPGQDYRAVIST